MHKLTAGDGYTYLTRHIAGGDVDRVRGQDAADYYTAKGNPPGMWVGRGAPLLDVAGQQVTEDQMRHVFGSGMRPDADRIIAEYLDEHLRADMTDRQLAMVRTDAIKAATLGTAFPAYEPLARFDSRVAERLEQIRETTGRAPTEAEIKKIHTEESRRARAAVAGFDLVFAPVKSAALVWALDERPEVRAAVREAHEAARDAALEILEAHAAYTRTGRGGIAQIETKGLIAARFDHFDSRAGDPNLHTHVAISSKVQGVDGIWRSLDARALYKMTVAVSEFYNTRFETELTGRIGVSWTERPDTIGKREPVREIAGIDPQMVAHFSSRRTEIEARYEQLLRTFRREHGYDPSRAVCHDLARQANLETRENKKAPRSLAEMREEWRVSLVDAFGRKAVRELMSAVPGTAAEPSAKTAEPVDVDAMAAAVVARVGQNRSTWTVWNLRAEAERSARIEHGVSTPAEHQELVFAIVTAAASPAHSIRVDAPALLDEPASLRRRDKESVFTEHGAARFTSAAILAAEARLVEAAKTHTAFGATAARVGAVLDGFEARSGVRLDAGQRAMATAFAVDDRLVVAGIGPAGSGKTTAMRAYAEVVAAAGQRLIPLATSSAAADVLARDLGTKAENLHKFLHEYSDSPTASASKALWRGTGIPAWARGFALRPGDVVLVDEAGMAGTFNLDWLVQIATHCGATVRLLGDYRQLGAVESGGALRLIANEAGAVELSTLHRFHNPREAEATLKVRVGDSSALDFYANAGRIRSGSAQGMIEAAYAGWKADMLAGKKTIMAAATTADVTALSAQARLDRIEAGHVEADGVRLRDGNLAGRGDWIVTRDNDRKNKVSRSRDWVKNGDAWTITKRHCDGSLTVKNIAHQGTVRLSAEYVATSVELLYATTTNRAQGSTVDTAHPLITAEMSRENLYVILSRAQERTTFYVETHELLPFDEDDRMDRVKNDPRQFAAREVLTAILNREGNEVSATEAIAASQQAAGSLATIAPRFQHALETAVRPAYKELVYKTFTVDDGTENGDTSIPDAIATGPGYAKLRRTLLTTDQAGHSPAALLARAANDLGITDADSLSEQPAADLARRINTLLDLRHTAAPDKDRRSARLPVWYAIPSAADASAAADIPRYLRHAQDVIASRVDQLADIAVAERPAWLSAFGPIPDDESAAVDWRQHVAVVAAYRDQHQITGDDPRQVLGSHADAEDAAGTPYRHALQAVLAARNINHLDDHADPREIYSALTESERRRVDLTITDSLEALFLGPGASVDERPVVHPEHLRLALLAHGHLDQREQSRIDVETSPTRPVEMSLADRRRATRDAERAARRERILSRQPQEVTVQRQQRSGQAVRPREAERQNGPTLIEPSSQTQQQGRRAIM